MVRVKKLNDNLIIEYKLGVINQLIYAIEHFHGIGIIHGDLHPKNIKISPTAADSDDIDYQLYLFDALDFTSKDSSNLNYEYAPSHSENATTQMHDIFVVMKMSCELLKVAWVKSLTNFLTLLKSYLLNYQVLFLLNVSKTLFNPNL